MSLIGWCGLNAVTYAVTNMVKELALGAIDMSVYNYGIMKVLMI